MNRRRGTPRAIPLVLLALVVGAGLWWRQQPSSTPSTAPSAVSGAARAPATALPGFLPPEAAGTLADIARGGPFPYRQDGAVFGNREHRLPAQPYGYYHEYTVQTPGSRDRGARRIVTGGRPPVVYYYTDDHYRSFRRFRP